MKVNEIVKVMELSRKKDALELKKSLGAECKEPVPGIPKTIEIVYPKQGKIDDIDKQLKEIPADKIKESISSKSGEAYKLLSERASITATNHDNRFEIAKLSIILSQMAEGERDAVRDAVRAGEIVSSLKAGSVDESSRKNLARFMTRCGIACSASEDEIAQQEPEEKEVSMTIENKKVWVNKETSEQLESNLKRMEILGSHLQVSNAKRQIMDFSDEEEKKYASIQAEYLELLKKQDELLKEFNAELNAFCHIRTES